jgi:hypothetical protein
MRIHAVDVQYATKGVMKMLTSISQDRLQRRGRRSRLILLSAAALVLLAAPAETVLAHDGPPGTFDRCASRIFSGDRWEPVSGLVQGRPHSVEQFYVRIVPAAPFGWSGTVNINGQPDHPPVWVPVSSSHWFPSPAIVTGSSGTFGFSLMIKPNVGVENYYSVEIYSPRPCSITS